MYELYKVQDSEDSKIPAKERYYRMVFNTGFDLVIRRPYTATWKILQNSTKKDNLVEARKYAVDKNCNSDKKLELQELLKKNANEFAKHSPNRQTICSDLQKTMPTSVLTCSTIYHLRNLRKYFGAQDL
jgi:hypothetical protein